ncbi:bifunctional metallophosphatase/5'-nucleotidase [Brachyspira hampsonii]|uniref:Bifunctional metallophosphatase/5'-nucleotidase n=1 Tax=Brachyspira hampsonii TaxID=1287055 RepID=A0AAC9TSH9_9SPIR|nr:bifunctional UDP-sugar hydrolase/5'-nucleotidase [Brachyspira hampsonii]ASJ20317.1 bifunctional metallophosphatase/5'-nucleotidase [Brachyspira hampsonii]ELV07076.1 UshA, 5'-nucleotidase/2',3'-cyclic phosphodiesterase-like esterase [Brachyspira hampsonii 30599]MBW5380495.1 bifunctional metallophosphatase/5'-nucleotidase [Brachyspira hampsonii]MBW5411082.1 bifunctional metallophosphatase/5'-nucleotidase [Brachyspira hampsonii]OEJ16358.1 bifunctional metallophosphatase/5'-nucleotidase [Brachy
MRRGYIIMSIFLSTLLASISCNNNKDRVYPEGEVNFTIVETTDIHGMIFPYNFITDEEETTSMAHISSYLKQLKNEGRTILLLENGDSLQGQPTVYYYNFVATNEPHIWSEVLNYMNYDVIGVGNHDVEAGHSVYDKLVKELKAPLVAANLIDENSKEPYFKPYTIVEKNGVKIAVLGLMEPAIDRQLPKVLYEGLATEDMVESAKKWIKIIKDKENPDMIIGLFHAGANHTDDKETYKNENASQLVAEQVDGFDIILVGHDHQGWSGLGYDETSKQKTKEVRSPSGKIVPIYGGVNSARYIASIDVSMIYNKDNKTWDIKFNGDLLDPSQFEADKEFLEKFADARANIEEWVSRDIGNLNTKLVSDEAIFGDSYFLSLIHQLQFKIAEKELGEKADISFAAPLSKDAVLNNGIIKVKDMFSLYPYENFFYVMKLTGKQIKDIMEYSYGRWFNTMNDINDHLIAFKKDSNGQLIFNNRYNSYDTITPSYNYESAAGLNYTVDVTRPNGEKVIIESFSDGRPFELDKEYKVAINSYRGSGGGGHLTQGAAIDLKTLQNMDLVLKSTDKDLRYYIINWFEEQNGAITVEKLNNWKVIPEDYVQAGKKKDYKLLYPDN